MTSVPVASCVRVWSIRIPISVPGAISPLTRCDAISSSVTLFTTISGVDATRVRAEHEFFASNSGICAAAERMKAKLASVCSTSSPTASPRDASYAVV